MAGRRGKKAAPKRRKPKREPLAQQPAEAPPGGTLYSCGCEFDEKGATVTVCQKHTKGDTVQYVRVGR